MYVEVRLKWQVPTPIGTMLAFVSQMELSFFTWIREVMIEVASCTLTVGITNSTSMHYIKHAALHEQVN